MSKKLKKLLAAIKKAAKAMEIHPSEVKPYQIYETDEEITDWDIRTLGGLPSIKKAYFPFEKEHAEIEEQKESSAYVKKLESKLGKQELFESRLLELIKNNTPVIPTIKPLAAFKKTKFKRHLVVMISDTHYGLQVDGAEIGNSNNYGWKEASRRTAFLIKQVCEYKLEKRSDTEAVHLILNGDIISGIIHNLTGRDNDLLIHQVNGAVHILSQAIAHLSQHFKNVHIYAVPGNHGDAPHRREGGGRVVSQPYDNFENIVFYALSNAFSKQANVHFNIPKTPYTYIDLPAGRIMAVHGHNIFGKQLGNPGNSINTKAMSDVIHRFSNAEVARGKPQIKMVLFGHTHVQAHFTSFDGITVYNAPSLSGIDPFAHNSLSVNNNFVGQLVFESTDEFIFGDNRLIKVDKGDNDKSLDEIISIFNRELACPKKEK